MWLSLVLIAFALAGCATYPMMPTPVLYTGAQAKPLFTDIAADRRRPSLDLLYVTDRAPATSRDDVGPYTASRSRYLAFGSTTVEFGSGVTWDTLVAQSTIPDRKDLLATAVSDLSVEAHITQTTLATRFKIGNIVLIAPDLDVDVAPTSSDLIALLRYGLTPNEPGRPLIEVARPFWRVPTGADSSDYGRQDGRYGQHDAPII